MHALSKLKPSELLLRFDPLLDVLEPDPVRRGKRQGEIERTIVSKIHAAVDEVYVEVSEEAETVIADIKLLEAKVAKLAAVVGERRDATVAYAGPVARAKWLGGELERLQKKQEQRETAWKALRDRMTPILKHLDSMHKLPDEKDLTRDGLEGMERLYHESAARLEVVKERLGELYDWLQEYSDGGPGQYESAYYTKSYRKNLRHFIKGKASSVPAYQLLESISSTLKFSLAAQHGRDIAEVTRLSTLDFVPSAPSSSHEDESEFEFESVPSTGQLAAPSESGRDESSGTGDADANDSDSDPSEYNTTLVIVPMTPKSGSPTDASESDVSTTTLALLQSAAEGDLESYNIRLSQINAKVRDAFRPYTPRRHIPSSPAASTSSSASRLTGSGTPPRQVLEARLSRSLFMSPVKIESGPEIVAQAFVNICKRGAVSIYLGLWLVFVVLQLLSSQSASPRIDRKPVLTESD